MESDTKSSPITLKQLSKRTNVLIGVAIVLTTFVLTLVGQGIYQMYNPPVKETVQASKITLNEIFIAYSPSSSDANIIFLDKKTNQVKLILSEDVTKAIFVLKSSGISQEYIASLKNKKVGK